MVVELEKAGITTVHVANMTPVSISLGCNRIVKSYGIPFPFCDPAMPEEVKSEQRYELFEKVLDVLSTEVTESTVFQCIKILKGVSRV